MNDSDPTRNLLNTDSANFSKKLDSGLSYLNKINHDFANIQQNERERQDRNSGRFDAADAVEYLMTRVETFQVAL